MKSSKKKEPAFYVGDLIVAIGDPNIRFVVTEVRKAGGYYITRTSAEGGILQERDVDKFKLLNRNESLAYHLGKINGEIRRARRIRRETIETIFECKED